MIGLHFRDDEFTRLPPQVTHVRLWDAGVTWRDIHIAPHTFDWRRLDDIIEACAGRHVLYVIGATPRWAAKSPHQLHYAPWLGPGSNSMPYGTIAFDEFVTALVKRYRGKIHAYEVWNEPQLAHFLYPYTDAECNVLAVLTRHVFNIVQANDRGALVLAASVLPRPSSGGMRRASRYLSALQRKGWTVSGFTTHIYPEVGTWGARWKELYDAASRSILSMNPPVKRLWVTETLFGLLGPELSNAASLGRAVKTVYSVGKPAYWYAWDRPDLGGSVIAAGKPTWTAIQAHNG